MARMARMARMEHQSGSLRIRRLGFESLRARHRGLAITGLLKDIEVDELADVSNALATRSAERPRIVLATGVRWSRCVEVHPSAFAESPRVVSLKSGRARSSGHCNNFSVDLGGCFPVEHLAWTSVHLGGNEANVLEADQIEVGALWKILAKQTVHVLVGGPLPG